MKEINCACVGDWEVEVVVQDKAGVDLRAVVEIPRPVPVEVRHEEYAGLAEYNPKSWAGWQKGTPLNSIKAQECTTCFSLIPGSLKVMSGQSSGAVVYECGKDYEAELSWGSVGRLPGGRIKPDQPVWISYDFCKQRLDSIIRDAEGKIGFKAGTPHIATPKPPALAAKEVRLANVYIDRQIDKLSADNLYPVLEKAFPKPRKVRPTVAERFLPKTMKRLQEGGKLKILAWGDSVTDGGFLADKERDRWQAQFVKRLRNRFPEAGIELTTEAWGGRNTTIYLAEPPGSEHNYQEKVLAVKPDLIVMEFVNDAELQGEAFERQYERLLADIRGIGAEWLILTPHYIRPDWMGLTRQKDIDEDPRPYVKALRVFAAKHGIPLAEGSLRYGRLWRQGIPYNTLMQNNINHPDPRGMKLFADSLMELFP